MHPVSHYTGLQHCVLLHTLTYAHTHTHTEQGESFEELL